MKTMSELFSEEGILQRHDKDKWYGLCPRCSHTRRAHNQKKPVLKVQVDGRGLRAFCCHCDYKAVRFLDEGEPFGRNAKLNSKPTGASHRGADEPRNTRNSNTLGTPRGASTNQARNITRDSAQTWDRIARPSGGIRNETLRRVVVPKVQSAAEEILDRARGRKVIAVERGLLPGLTCDRRNTDNLRR